MYQKLSFHIVGVVPLLMHNGRLANPLDRFAKGIKTLTSKRKKTDDDHLEIAHLEFLGGLYLDDSLAPCIPGINLEGCLTAGAKKQRRGEQFKAGLMVEDNWPLLYDGPRDANKLWEDEAFRDIRPAGVRGSTVMRCRPKFPRWELKFEAKFEDGILNASEVAEALVTAGRYIGLCDFVPRFGRFEVRAV